MKPHIYKVTNLINGKIYIGQHIGTIKNYFAGGVYIKKAIKKYGKNNFKREIIIEGDFTKEELDELEIKYIELYKSYYHDYPNNGYNLTKGGSLSNTLGIVHSEKTLKLLRENSPNKKSVVQLDLFGKYMNKYSSIRYASKVTGILDTSILRCCQSEKINNKSAGGFMWVYESEYNPKNVNQINLNYYKKVKQFDLYGNFINEYNSIKEAAKSVGVSATAVSNMLRGITKKAGGFIWSF